MDALKEIVQRTRDDGEDTYSGPEVRILVIEFLKWYRENPWAQEPDRDPVKVVDDFLAEISYTG